MSKFHADSMAQDLKSTMRITGDWEDLRPDAREVLDRLQSAIGRIIAGEGGEEFRELLYEAIEVGGGKDDWSLKSAGDDLQTQYTGKEPDDKIISPGFRIGDKVRIVLRGLSECGVTGTVNFFDTATGWYSVDLDSGPPWRGYYTVWELEHITAQGDGQGGKPNGGKDDETR